MEENDKTVHCPRLLTDISGVLTFSSLYILYDVILYDGLIPAPLDLETMAKTMKIKPQNYSSTPSCSTKAESVTWRSGCGCTGQLYEGV